MARTRRIFAMLCIASSMSGCSYLAANEHHHAPHAAAIADSSPSASAITSDEPSSAHNGESPQSSDSSSLTDLTITTESSRSTTSTTLAPTPEQNTSGYTSSASTSNPLTGNPTEVNARTLAYCQALALRNITGYIQEDTLDGQLVSRSRVNTHPLSAEIESFDAAGKRVNHSVLNQNTIFVQHGTSWVQASVDSPDKNLAYQATIPARFETLLNPSVRASGTDPALTYRVTGKKTVNGQTIFTLTLSRSNDDDIPDSDVHLVIRSDCLVLRAESSYNIDGVDHTRVSTTRDIDIPQYIEMPSQAADTQNSAASSPSLSR
ncbi:hypothetical protein [Trueperella sp. LYQ143]|uniref:hypothetical protein n=1 Tax=Trueperella sp. LYQ143 TaxID=3391059 RepID=UPI00398360FC